MVEFAMLITVDSETDKLSAEERLRYLAAWRRYKLLRNTGIASLALCFLFTALNQIVFFIGFFLLAIPIGFALALWNCPRCGKTFSGGLFGVGWRRQPWVRSCYWCELRKSDLAALQNGPSASSLS